MPRKKQIMPIVSTEHKSIAVEAEKKKEPRKRKVADIDAIPVVEETSKSKKTKKKEEEPSTSSGGKAAAKNKSSTEFETVDFSSSKKSASGHDWNLKISCWNIGGVRAWQKKGGIEYIDHEKPDIFCVQEVKISKDKLEPSIENIPGYTSYWSLGATDGYAGVGIYSKVKPLSVKNGIGDKHHDKEGRVITAEYEKFYLVNVYVPNAGRGLKTLDNRMNWDPLFRNYLKTLDETKPVVVCGDMNVAHTEIDIKNAKSNRRNAGFTQEERDGFTTLLGEGFVDIYRHLNPDKAGVYTFWTYMMNARSKNIGWRLDYFLVSERLLPSVCDNLIRSEIFGSDHCPIVLLLQI